MITNYHVIEPVILGKAAPNDVILRFDYKKLPEGKVVNPGIEYRLIEDEDEDENYWLIDRSPYTDNDLPTIDELDYALLRVGDADGKPPRRTTCSK